MIRVVLVDDEPYALDMLEILLRENGNVVVVGKYKNPLYAVEEIGNLRADAVFLDIEMPGMKGNDAARAIQAINPNMHIVFTTAYMEYAIEAFEIKALDYLLKPIRIERLNHSVKRIEEAMILRGAGASAEPMITCMGDFSVPIGDTELSWRTTKEKELCAFLVHHLGQAIDQAVIIEALWREFNTEKARSYLYTRIWQLRKNLRASGLPITVNKIGKRYSIDIGNMAYDVNELEQLLNKTLEEDGLDAGRLERIVALYQGNYMGACDFRWALGKKEQLSAKYVQALRKLYLLFKENSQSSSALDCLKRIVAVSPDSEKDGRELIQLHMEAGNRNEAIKAYRQLEKAVRDRMDVELEEETLNLYRLLVSSDSGSRSGL
jgi:two-component system LytT family response regulator